MWTIRGVLAALFVMTGMMKLTAPTATLTAVSALPVLFLRFIGACEVLGALGLVLPPLLRIKEGLAPLAAGGLTVIMAGATIATLLQGGGAAALLPLAIGIVLPLLIRQFLASQPGVMHIERSLTISARPDEIFPLVENFRDWDRWSPYERIDPGMRKTFSGAASGAGAVYEWSGNRKAGAGRARIVESQYASRIVVQLEFIRPFAGHKTAEFTFTKRRGGTAVTWAMYGPQDNLCKLMAGLLSMDQMIGREFEKGLAELKNLAENGDGAGKHLIAQIG